MRLPSSPRYGRTIDLPLTLGKRAEARIAAVLLVPLLFLLPPLLASHPDPRLTTIRLGGYVLIPLCAYIAFSIYRASRWADCRFTLTQRDVTVPLFPVYRRQSRTVPLEDVLGVGVGFVGRFLALELMDASRVYKVPADWFPRDWPVAYVAARLRVRVDQRRQGRTLTPKALAVLEAGVDHVDAPDRVLVHGEIDAPEVLTIE